MAVNSYTVVDIMKPTPTKIDLASSFNGRVGDSQSFTKLWFKRNGLPLDLTNYTIYFEGKDANGTPVKLVDYGKADQTGDNLQAGKVTFYFPAGTFQVEGDWDFTTTFFGIKDSNGTVISTVNVGIHVLGNSVDFGIDSKPFYTDLDELNKQMQDYINDKKGKIDSMLSEVLDKDSNLNQNLSSLTSLIETYQKLIDAKAIITQDDFNVFKKTVDETIKTIAGKTYVVGDRGTTLTPQQYLKQYLGESVTEWKYADLILGTTVATNPWAGGVGHLDVYGYLHTDVSQGAEEGNSPGTVMQEFKCGWNGVIHIFVRTNAANTTWTAWSELTQW